MPEEHSRGRGSEHGDSPSRAGKRQASVLVSPASPCSANPHSILGPKERPGHGLPSAARAAVTIVEGNLFPVPAQCNTPLVPRQRREKGSFLREARSRSRGGVGFPVFIFLPHKNSVFEPVWKTGRRRFVCSDAITAFRGGSSWLLHPKVRNSVNASRAGRSLGCVFPKSPRGRHESSDFGSDVRSFVWEHVQAEAFGATFRAALLGRGCGRAVRRPRPRGGGRHVRARGKDPPVVGA